MDANAPLPDDFEDKGNIDSDEERDAVMAAINRYYRPDPYTGTRTMGSPLTTWNPVPVRRRYHQIRLREAMRSALDGVESTKLFQQPEYFNTSNNLPIFSAT
jgi:SAGA-associated factor 73